jgi:hypothetical protein
MEFDIISVYNENEFICNLVGLKSILKYTPEAELLEFLNIKHAQDIQIIIFETSNGIDLAKIVAENTILGVRAESIYGNYLYPDFEKNMQSLLFLKIGNNKLPFDLIKYVNNISGEEKYIYYDISSFYGRDLNNTNEKNSSNTINIKHNLKKEFEEYLDPDTWYEKGHLKYMENRTLINSAPQSAIDAFTEFKKIEEEKLNEKLSKENKIYIDSKNNGYEVFLESINYEYNNYKKMSYNDFPNLEYYVNHALNKKMHVYKTDYQSFLNYNYEYYISILEKINSSIYKSQLMDLRSKSHIWLGHLNSQDPFSRMYWVVQDYLYYNLSLLNPQMHKINLMFMEFFKNKRGPTEYDQIQNTIFDHHSTISSSFFYDWLLEYNEKYLDEVEFSPMFTMFLYPITLTEFGKNNILSIIDVFGEKLDEYYSKNNVTLLRNHFNKYKIRDLSRMKKLKDEIKILSRESENQYRKNKNLPQIGENWIEETLLYYKIKEDFSKLKIIQHGRPNFLGQQHYDIWIPKLNIAIEYQGEQHLRPIDFFGGQEAYEKQQERDKRKYNISVENGIEIIYVFRGYDYNEIIKKIKDKM